MLPVHETEVIPREYSTRGYENSHPGSEVSRPDVGPGALQLGLIRFGRYLRRGIAAFGVLLIALLLTVLAYYYVRQTVEVQNRARFEEST
jgi:hypothetical protein